MKDWKALALALALFSILISASYFYRMSERASVKELKIIWPDPDEISARWCSVNSTRRYLESALISCRDDSCYALVRYLSYFPTDDEFEEELPLEIWREGQRILRVNVTAFKRSYALYIQTVALVVKFPRGSEIRVLDLTLKPSECLKEGIEPPQVIHTKGIVDDWIVLGNGFRVHRVFDDLYAATWKGNASLICGNLRINLRGIEPAAGDLALISIKDRCEVELNGLRSPIGS